MEPLEEHKRLSGIGLKQVSYVQNDYSPLNSFIDVMIENDKAKVKQINAKIEAHKLRKVIILLLICLLLLLSALIGLAIFKVKSLTFETINSENINQKNFDDTKSAALKKLAELKITNAQSGERSKSIKNVTTNTPEVIIDYTLFETIGTPKNLFPSIQSVTTGFKFSNSEDENPSFQHCYGTSVERYGNRFVNVALARFENGTLKPETITADELSQLNLTELEFKDLRRYCKFR
jgi:hypothetical protein